MESKVRRASAGELTFVFFPSLSISFRRHSARIDVTFSSCACGQDLGNEDREISCKAELLITDHKDILWCEERDEEWLPFGCYLRGQEREKDVTERGPD